MLDFQSFKRFSGELGADEMLVQGAGGNTSIKLDGVLWVKASGTWLKDAETSPIFMSLSLDRLDELLSRRTVEESALRALRDLNGSAHVPSIETPLHALLPHAVVAHVHSIRTIAWAVRADAEARLSERLSGLSWAFIRYARPGAPLAMAVRKVLGEARCPDVLVLGNHGLVVGGENVAGVRALIDDVETRLELFATEPPPLQLPDAPLPEQFRWADDPWITMPSFDDESLRIAASGSLYPDHVVFLGPRIRIAEQDCELTPGPEDKLIYVRGKGAIARRDLSPGAQCMARCLGHVLARLERGAPIKYLSPEEERALQRWDAESYRAQLDSDRI